MNAKSTSWLCALAAIACTAPPPAEPEPERVPVAAHVDPVPDAPVRSPLHVAPDEPAAPIELAESPPARDGWHVTVWPSGVSLPIYGAIVDHPRRTR
ncbi:MAG TPA: hypothetical protein VFZ65_22380 [Planctomycetota bacterium]|nr:hypothetical protein [Planctomycetota bacterium]